MSSGNSTTISGTKEWSVASVNCVNGCSHNCRYCYARYNAVERFGRISAEDWPTMQVRPHDVRKPRKKHDGRVMFPSTHDITPKVLVACTTVLEKLLVAGNDVLIVSKPHLECIEHLCRYLARYRSQVLFRFTVGALSESILAYWEPGAPSFEERLACLRYARKQGYETSVSCEPLLEPERIVELVKTLSPHVSDTIWIGMLNSINSRVVAGTSAAEIARIREWQNVKDRVLRVYHELKDLPYIRWKESYKKVLGLELAKAAGLDI
ncbi:MAG: hypothetical protein HQ582_09165 [Planctomycetes bacterium]|nr:hypothetical protein [Planctomycetota bacterium]